MPSQNFDPILVCRTRVQPLPLTVSFRVDRENPMTLSKFICHWLTMLVMVPAVWKTPPKIDEPTRVRPFTISAVDGTTVELKTTADPSITVICFVGTQCPLAKLYGPRLQQLQDEFRSKHVRVIGIGSNLQDSPAELREFAAAHQLNFPIAKDFDNIIADQLGAKRTPEVFVIDRQLQIRYRGRIDDQYLPGISRPHSSRDDLRIALQQLLAGQTVSVPETDIDGCLIGRVKAANGKPATNSVTYASDIARVFHENCVECHRPGEIGPFSLTDYDEAIGWADMIVEVVDAGRMPPWHAAEGNRELANQRVMPESDKQALRDWLAAGTPHGDPAQLPPPPTFVDGWRLPRGPDLVLEMSDRPFVVPAQGTVEYQYFVVDPGFEQDQWIAAAQVVPGNRRVVHHSIVFVRPPDGAAFRGIGWIGAYVPGQGTTPWLPGHARRVPAGSKFVFQQHYTPVGRQQSDVTKVGLLFAEADDVTHELLTLIGIDQDFEIPPRSSEFAVDLRVPRLPAHGQLLSAAPHMHWRGKSFRLFARHHGDRHHADRHHGDREVLLEVPRYDFNWQHNYHFKQPIPLEAIDALEATVVFDNSSGNPANPNPDEFVMWGDQTWEEMAVAFFGVALPLTPPSSEQVEAGPSTVAQPDATVAARAEELTQQFIRRFDRDGDHMVSRDETPRALRRFGFWQIDDNLDNQLTRDEILRHATRRVRANK